MSQLKPFSGLLSADLEWNARHSDGRYAMQVRTAVLAPTKAAASRALGVSVHYVTNWFSLTGNADDLKALASYPPLTVLIEPLGPQDTINGTTGWRPR